MVSIIPHQEEAGNHSVHDETLHGALSLEITRTEYEWKRLEKEWRYLQVTVTERSQAYVATLRHQVAMQRKAFAAARRQWIAFMNTHPLIPHAARI
ncbi:MAG: hypothetical protein HY352_04945 [Candidatus Omnitrophica bacterium]|nr:hypothetical protein [Candidatus Omnitrophota bacterium]